MAKKLSPEELERQHKEEGFASVKWLNPDGTPKTTEEIRDIQISTWNMSIYDHFEHVPKICIHSNSKKVLYTFKCQKPRYILSISA
ncbi:hypothetical protein BOTBODRAFT_178382 [Botryobasidium botryosum FD-172 SS1]|uniref:Uncharacterized protein n=1 Tax=Botryobasidium botryosum (strain FD-172 SS1) TaxID=930990 RepID=A0A067M349_BOTB1|nr:hypothetical protein BOTBODRAFT_178382 [Botryobasidium botryosum FD-172 SS1]